MDEKVLIQLVVDAFFDQVDRNDGLYVPIEGDEAFVNCDIYRLPNDPGVFHISITPMGEQQVWPWPKNEYKFKITAEGEE